MTTKKTVKDLLLNRYGNVQGIPSGFITTSLTKTQLKKLEVPTVKCCTGFVNSYGRHYAPVLENLVSKKDYRKIKKYLETETLEWAAKRNKDNEFFESNKSNISVIGEALYSINKEAKRQRDKQNQIASEIYSDIGNENEYESVYEYQYEKQNSFNRATSQQHDSLHRAKNRKEELYGLKETIIYRLVEKFGIKPLGYHTFPDGRSRDYYTIGGYSFHMHKFGFYSTLKNLGEINEEITSIRQRCMPPAKAEEFLKKFLKEN
jgi:hypothetical protein